MAVAEREIIANVPGPAPRDEPHPFRWTREQYHRLAEMGWFEGRRVELIEGQIVEMPPMDVPHFRVINTVGDVLKAAFGDGYFVTNQSPLSLGLSSDPESDFAVVPGSVRDVTRETGLPTSAALVVEASASTLAYDRTRKAALYAEAAIPEYWILNLEDGQVEVYRQPRALAGGAFGYAETRIYQPGEVITASAASGSPVAVAGLLP